MWSGFEVFFFKLVNGHGWSGAFLLSCFFCAAYHIGFSMHFFLIIITIITVAVCFIPLFPFPNVYRSVGNERTIIASQTRFPTFYNLLHLRNPLIGDKREKKNKPEETRVKEYNGQTGTTKSPSAHKYKTDIEQTEPQYRLATFFSPSSHLHLLFLLGPQFTIHSPQSAYRSICLSMWFIQQTGIRLPPC
jgi:hypothetical protein